MPANPNELYTVPAPPGLVPEMAEWAQIGTTWTLPDDDHWPTVPGQLELFEEDDLDDEDPD